MTCEQAELRMAELLAGEMAPAERSALDQHLLDCESCRGDFELARAGARVEWRDVPVPKELVEATLASFREPPAAVRLLRWATAAAAVFGVAVLLVTSSRTPRPASRPIVEPHAQRREILATMQDAAVGALVCKDEDGRPVGELGLKSHDVTVEILDGIAKTTVEENFENFTDRRLEGTFNFPLPSDASISRLALEVNGKIEEGTCLERERAREVFESIVRRMQDPALLEWQPGGFFKCRVFPIEPRSTKRVIVAYTQALPCFRGRMSYVYPLVSEKTQTHPPEELRISVLARFSGALAKIESPSHRLDVQRKNANEASMAFHAANYRPKNDFVVTLEPADEELRVVSHRPEGEDGYFACFLTPRGGAERAPGRYAFVLDASASTSAPRLEVAKRLVRAMMERRIPGDRFEILAHNIEVEHSGEVDLRAANDFMDRLRPIGGSDVLKALLEAPRDAELVYIGKGSPSFGESDPAKILEAVKGRRIRTIAVGSDANGLLLEKLGGMLRVSPNDDVDKRVEQIAATIGSPVISELKVQGEGIAEVVGARDVFYGERLVVSGRYREGATKLLIAGRGYRREFVVALPAKEEGNNYVRRLWAQRKVADLLALGESTKAAVTTLGIKYQIMTPYTSFLVLETEQMWKGHQLQREVQKQDEVLGKVKSTFELDFVARPKKWEGKSGDERRDLLELVEEASAKEEKYKESIEGLKAAIESDRRGSDTEQRLRKPTSLQPKEPVVIDPTPAPPTVKPVAPTPDLKVQTQGLEAPEDPKARAIREAYEEQLRRDRQEVIVNAKNATVNQVVEEFRRQTGWNIIVDHKNIPSEYRVDEMRVTKEDARAALDAFAVANGLELEPLSFDGTVNAQSFWLGSPRHKLELYDVQDLSYAMADFPGVDITLAQDVEQANSIKLPPADATRTALLNGVIQLNQGLNQSQKSNSEGLPRTEEETIAAPYRRPRWTLRRASPEPAELQDMDQAKAARINDLKRKLYSGTTEAAKLETDMQVFVRQQELQLAQLQELTAKLDEHRAKLAKSLNEKSLAATETQYARQMADRLQQDLAQLEEKRVEMARDQSRLEEKINPIAQSGGGVNVAPKKALEAKVTAVANEISLLVISIGKDDGVLEGDEFTVYRGGDFVAKIVIDRSDRKWSAGKIVLRKGDPRVGDDVSNHLFLSGARTGGKVLSGEGERARLVDSGSTGTASEILALTRDSKFVALVRVVRGQGKEFDVQVYQGLAAGRILPGDHGTPVADVRAYLEALPAEVRMDLASRSNQQAIRAKMGWKP